MDVELHESSTITGSLLLQAARRVQSSYKDLLQKYGFFFNNLQSNIPKTGPAPAKNMLFLLFLQVNVGASCVER